MGFIMFTYDIMDANGALVERRYGLSPNAAVLLLRDVEQGYSLRYVGPVVFVELNDNCPRIGW